MLPGGGCMHLVDSLGKNKNIEYTACLHEQAAAIAAEANYSSE
jgi:acetolactate synthase-1/2/3 large subunit